MSRTPGQALGYMRAQVEHPSQSWKDRCQELCRKSYDAEAIFGTAYAQWLGADSEDRHYGPIESAPPGALLCFKGSNPAGHIDEAAHPFGSGPVAAFSNDLVVVGRVNKVERTAPETHWGQRYLGWLSTICGHAIDFDKPHRPAKPKQDQHYARLERAIHNLEHALDTAQDQHDHADAEALRQQVKVMQRLYVKLRHA